MKSITEKTLKQINNLEKLSLTPNAKYSKLNSNPKGVDDVKVYIDASDEENVGENSNIFTAFNSASEVSSLRVDVKIDEDVEDESGDPSVSEGGEETVMGQGTNPKPEDETYLSLLKKTTPTPKIKIKVDK